MSAMDRREFLSGMAAGGSLLAAGGIPSLEGAGSGDSLAPPPGPAAFPALLSGSSHNSTQSPEILS